MSKRATFVLVAIALLIAIPSIVHAQNTTPQDTPLLEVVNLLPPSQQHSISALFAKVGILIAATSAVVGTLKHFGITKYAFTDDSDRSFATVSIAFLAAVVTAFATQNEFVSGYLKMPMWVCYLSSAAIATFASKFCHDLLKYINLPEPEPESMTPPAPDVGESK